MPAQVKLLENQSRHMTRKEAQAREEAEAATVPHRALEPKKPPKSLAGDSRARSYWKATLRKMAGYDILDVLDADTLALWCSMLSRRDAMNKLCVQLVAAAGAKELSADERLDLMEKADGLSARLQTHEKTLLSYAKELGLTPIGRVQLARRRSAAAATEDSDDLFGD